MKKWEGETIMYFAWFEFWSILGFFFFIFGSLKKDFASYFIGSVFLAMLGAVVFATGITDNNSFLSQDINASASLITYIPKQITGNQDLMIYAVGTLYGIIGVAGMLLSVLTLYKGKKEKGGWING